MLVAMHCRKSCGRFLSIGWLLRRLLSLLLLATLGAPLWASMLALGQSADSLLPACCRRDGKHHCAMSSMGLAQMAGSQSPQWRSPQERCPYCPGSIAAGHHHEVGSTARADEVFVSGFAHPQGRPQTESKRRISEAGSRRKRGPPQTFLA